MADPTSPCSSPPRISDDKPPAPLPSPSAQAPPPSDDLASPKPTRDPGSRNPDSSSDNLFALIPPASYNALSQLWPLASRLLSDQWPLKWFLLPAQPGSPRQSEALRAFLTEVNDGRFRLARNLAIVLFATLVNHVRRMVFPALGVGGFGAPIATLKLAVGSPEIFLREEVEMGFLGRNSGSEALWKVVGDLVGGYAVKDVLVGGLGRWKANRSGAGATQGSDTGLVPGPDPSSGVIVEKDDGWREVRERRGRRLQKEMVTGAVVYFVWVLGCAEYVHARAVHAVAVGIAYTKLFRGGPVHRQALGGILFPPAPSSCLKVLGFHFELAYYVVCGLFPLLFLAIRFAFARNPKNSKPGLASLVAGWAWGTGFVTRYSNKYYIGLEMSGLLLVLWWILAAAAVLGWNSLRTRFKL